MRSWLRRRATKRRAHRADQRWREHEVVALVSFLRARYDEVKSTASAAAVEGTPDWHLQEHPADRYMVQDGKGHVVVYDEGSPGLGQAAHMVMQDPKATLLDIEAKEKILWLAEGAVKSKTEAVHVLALWSLRAFASTFPDHADFCDRWKL